MIGMTRVPCPFCNSVSTRVKTVWQTYKFVACDGCKAGGPIRKTEREAVDAWNSRPGLKAYWDRDAPGWAD